jgi:hypothetical protein
LIGGRGRKGCGGAGRRDRANGGSDHDCLPECAQRIITDSRADSEVTEKLRAMGLEVIVV